MAEVALSNVRKIYDGDVAAVRDASFTAADREFLVLVGPSGCGKSTLLRMVAGLETVTAGTISIDGKVVNDVPPRSRDIALVFQNYALYPHMTAFDNMALGLKIRKMPKGEIRERVREAARLLDIENLLNRRPGQLSGGQRQRVAVGRAIVRRPRVFLFDEPLSNLDPDMRVEMRTEISRLHRRLGVTMIYVTHDQTEAMTMGDRIVVIRDGAIQQIASPLELYDRPVNRFVASFVGNPHMNFFRVTLERGHLVVAGQRLAVQGAIPADLAALEGRDLLLGVRPENLRLEDESPTVGTWCEMTSTLDVVEPLGSETLLYWRFGETTHVSRAAPTQGRDVGGPLRIRADLSRAHFFDPDTEQTVLSWPGAG